MTESETPLSPTHRVRELDILRGLAIFGILFMNLSSFNGGAHWANYSAFAAWPAWWDRVALWIHSLLFAGKFNALLSLVFGIGFSLLMDRLSRRPGGTWTFVRRMLVLLAFGFAHAILLYSGDVLQNYALVGLILVAVRAWRDRVLLVLAACLLVTPVAFYVAVRLSPPPVRTAIIALNRPYIQNFQAERKMPTTSYREVTLRRGKFLLSKYRSIQYYFTSLPEFGGTILLGFVLARRGWLVARERLATLQRWLLPLLLAGWLLAAAKAAINQSFASWPPFPPGTTAPWWGFWLGQVGSLSGEVQRVLLSLAYASILLWLVDRARAGFWTNSLAAIGRTPLTTYIGQSAICSLLFHGYGLGLAGRCGPALSLLVAPMIGAALAAFSIWWLRHHDYGPLEWVWRELAYSRTHRKS